MTKTIEYYFTPASPWSYLGTARLRELAEKYGAEVKVRPVDYGTIFPQTGGLPLNKRPQARQDYRIQELKRWRQRLGRPINLHPQHFPFADAEAAKAIVGVDLAGGDALAAAEAIGRAVWEQERDMADPEEIRAVLAEAGLDAEAAMAKAAGPEAEKLRQDWTEEALAKGVFGAPTYVVGDEVLWGQDRLDFLEEELAA